MPQGGTISPVIANMTLDGLEKAVSNAADEVLRKANKKPKTKGKTSTWVHTIRYADDFVITAVSSRMLDGPIREAVNKFLEERGLSLNQEKTHLTSIKKGFNFLGFHFKQYHNSKS